MCGRYVLYGPITRLQRQFALHSCPEITPRYNIPPQTEVLIVRQRPGVGRVGQLVRWGLVPNWAKDPSAGARLNNARAEGIADKPSFRSSFSRHRCLIPANGFYEWAAISENGKLRKQPHFIRPAEDDVLFAFAGLLARWRAPDGSDLITTCVITTSPNDVMAPIHDRMPVILDAKDWETWLDPEQSEREVLLPLLKPAPNEGLLAFPVSPRVNRASDDEPSLIMPWDASNLPA